MKMFEDVHESEYVCEYVYIYVNVNVNVNVNVFAFVFVNVGVRGFSTHRLTKSSCACDCGRGPVSVGVLFFLLSSFFLLSFFLLSSSLSDFCRKSDVLGRLGGSPGWRGGEGRGGRGRRGEGEGREMEKNM